MQSSLSLHFYKYSNIVLEVIWPSSTSSWFEYIAPAASLWRKPSVWTGQCLSVRREVLPSTASCANYKIEPFMTTYIRKPLVGMRTTEVVVVNEKMSCHSYITLHLMLGQLGYAVKGSFSRCTLSYVHCVLLWIRTGTSHKNPRGQCKNDEDESDHSGFSCVA